MTVSGDYGFQRALANCRYPGGGGIPAYNYQDQGQVVFYSSTSSPTSSAFCSQNSGDYLVSGQVEIL